MGAADAMGAIGAVWTQPAEPRRPAPGAQAVRAAGGRAAPGHGPGLWRRMHQLCAAQRSEEHTSELQSHSDLVCRLLLEKKKKKKIWRTSNEIDEKHVIL